MVYPKETNYGYNRVITPKEGESMKLEVGQKAPDFCLPGHTGQEVTLSELRGQNVVLAFFPMAWTPI